MLGFLREKLGKADSSEEPVEKNITLERPSHVELICQFTKPVDLNSVNVFWEKNGEVLENNSISNATGNVLYAQYKFTVINSNQMGSYSCFFGEKKKHRGTFTLKVPEIKGKNKPIITYVGDTVILVCKCQHCSPISWTWYHRNGSVQVPVDIQTNDKFYMINRTYSNETKLKIVQLSEKDQGLYACHAVYQLGESEMLIELVVLSYLVPLKPFLAIVAEVIVLVSAILLCEMYTHKKKCHSDGGKEFEQIEQLKSDDSSNGIENNAPRHRINSVTSK
ncbi:PREDICTED: embigin-like [Elephantulus edwardii]|uniref:embigin-like n=1 Tax=Elephantulus edwardii TaxID=28737 RepID=UPI0003F0EC5E|nr:PREDICTED: embigin-like [Elephantulus edwardii]